MNFTREPIIETIVSPKDGYKLCIRNSKVPGSEEIFVDAVEVVSFGQSFFYRGQERPKPFLVPVSDYEVFEVKETRVVLKNVTHDRSIKIGGGRDASLKPVKELIVVEKKEEAEEPKELELAVVAEAPLDLKNDRKRDRRRSRRRRIAEEKKGDGEKDKSQETEESVSLEDSQVEEGDDELVIVRLPPTFSQILPPPTVLISERLNQLRNQEIAKNLLAEKVALEEGEKEFLVGGSSSSAELADVLGESSSEEISEGNVKAERSSKRRPKIHVEEEMGEDFNF